MAVAAAAPGRVGGLVALAPARQGPAPLAPNPSTVFQLSLGDSLAAGTGASVPANDYVNLLAAHEASHIPGLQVENLACGGATTKSMLDASDPRDSGCQTYTGGTQLARRRGLPPRPTRARSPTSPSTSGPTTSTTASPAARSASACLTTGLGEITTQLPTIVQGLQAAAPGVPDLRDGLLQPVPGRVGARRASGPALAQESAPLSSILNGSLVNIYGADRAVPVDVQGAFATQDFAMTGTWAGVTVPQNVARTCEWTHMCDNSGRTPSTPTTSGTPSWPAPSSRRSTAGCAAAGKGRGWPTRRAASTWWAPPSPTARWPASRSTSRS